MSNVQIRLKALVITISSMIVLSGNAAIAKIKPDINLLDNKSSTSNFKNSVLGQESKSVDNFLKWNGNIDINQTQILNKDTFENQSSNSFNRERLGKKILLASCGWENGKLVCT